MSLNVVGALKGSPYEDVSKDLAVEFKSVGLTLETLGNAPLKLKRTLGVDIYAVMALIEAYAEQKSVTKETDDGSS